MGFPGPECLGCGHPASAPTISRCGLQHREAPETQAWLVLTALGRSFGPAPSAHSDHKGDSLLSAALGAPLELCYVLSGLGQWRGGGF